LARHNTLSVDFVKICCSLAWTQRGRAAIETAKATAEHAKYAEAGRETVSGSFPRVPRISRFPPVFIPHRIASTEELKRMAARKRCQKNNAFQDSSAVHLLAGNGARRSRAITGRGSRHRVNAVLIWLYRSKESIL